MSLLAARLRVLNFAILAFEAAIFFFHGQGFLNKVLFTIFIGDTRTEEFGRTFNNRTNLGILGRFCLAAFFFIVAFGIEHISHAQKLEIPLQLWCKDCLGEVKPLWASSGLFLRLKHAVSTS